MTEAPRLAHQNFQSWVAMTYTPSARLAVAWLIRQAESDFVHHSSQAQSAPVKSAGSHSGCASANKTDVTAAAMGVTLPIGTRRKSLSISHRIRNDRQNSSSITGTTTTSPSSLTAIKAQRAKGSRAIGIKRRPASSQKRQRG